jgi:superfamily II DNA/RNA helicase
MIDKILQNLKIEALNEMQQAAVSTAVSHDMILLAPTGSGKTLAYLIPVTSMLHIDLIGIQALVLVPSRELALQTEQVFKAAGTGFKVSCCYGGHPVKIERNNLREPPAVLIGTPGRIAYHIREANLIASTIHTLVIDEFDKSLELGFEDDMAFIIGSAGTINRRILTSATRIDRLPGFSGAENAVEVDFLKDAGIKPDLSILGLSSDAEVKVETLFSLICMTGDETSLIFCNHRDAADRISRVLWETGLDHGIFHGGMEQEEREKSLLKFRNGTYRVLITTDLASRGLDIPQVGNIIHYQLPHDETTFLHRNGRTARMKSTGTVYVMLNEDELPSYLGGLSLITVPERVDRLPENSPWITLYISAGKKDKVNRGDIAGFLMKQGNLEKDELGLIEVKDHASYAAVRRSTALETIELVKNAKIKNKRVKIEISN